MTRRAFTDQLYAEFAAIGKALASAHRLELMDLLAQGERSVEGLAQEAGLTPANASAHLQVLRRARLVEADKRGLYVMYRLAGPDVERLWRALRDVGSARRDAVDQLAAAYLTDRRGLEPVSHEELHRRLTVAAVTVIDVRPAAEYRQGHIPTARSVPLDELEQRLAELPRDRLIVAYCRGPYCVLADDAVRLLRRHRFPAQRLRDGFPEWRSAGYPIATDERAS